MLDPKLWSTSWETGCCFELNRAADLTGIHDKKPAVNLWLSHICMEKKIESSFALITGCWLGCSYDQEGSCVSVKFFPDSFFHHHSGCIHCWLRDIHWPKKSLLCFGTTLQPKLHIWWMQLVHWVEEKRLVENMCLCMIVNVLGLEPACWLCAFSKLG